MIEFLKILQTELGIFDKKLQKTLSIKEGLLYNVANYLKKSKGKKIRPILTIISAGLFNNITDKTYRGAIMVELLHLATLIHDDIVDDAQLRRQRLAINVIWKNKVSVLTGDYFLAKGLDIAILNKDYDILSVISSSVQKIVRGELLQIEKTKRLNLIEKDYFKIIQLKTASLFESAFYIGAISADLNNKSAE